MYNKRIEIEPHYIQDFACHRDRRPELWVMDEHRLGLKPIVRRVWTQRGQRPTAIVEPRYEW